MVWPLLIPVLFISILLVLIQLSIRVHVPSALSNRGRSVRLNPEYTPENSSVRVSTARPVQRTAATPSIYLIALNDRSVHVAQAYWIDGPTLHDLTFEHEQRQIPLDAIDRALTLQLNRERHVPFQLPIKD